MRCYGALKPLVGFLCCPGILFVSLLFIVIFLFLVDFFQFICKIQRIVDAAKEMQQTMNDIKEQLLYGTVPSLSDDGLEELKAECTTDSVGSAWEGDEQDCE